MRSAASLEPPEVKIVVAARTPQRNRGLSVAHVPNIRDEMGKFGEVVGAVKPGPSGPSKPVQGQLDRIGSELVSTEKTYVHGLRQVSEIACRLHLKVNTPFEVLTYDEIKSVFHNWDQLLLLHQGLLKGMRNLQNNGPGNGDLFAGLGALIIDHLPYMQAVYSEYVNAYEKAMEKLTSLRERKQKFEDFVEFEEEVINQMANNKAKTSEHVARIDLNSLLVTPIQRIPRYLLLLDQMLKFGGTGARLQEAAQKIHEVAANVNDSFKKKEMRDRVVAIDKRLRNLVPAQVRGLAVSYKDKDRSKISLVHQCRFFVREGCLLKKSRHRYQNLRSYNERFLILFNDLLLYASPVDSDAKNLSVHHVLSLYQLVCGEAPLKRPDEPKTKFFIRVVGGKEDLVLRAKTQEERDAWITDITKWARDTTERQNGLQQRQNNDTIKSATSTRSSNLSPLSTSSQDLSPLSPFPFSPENSQNGASGAPPSAGPSPTSASLSSVVVSVSPPPVAPPPYTSPSFESPPPPKSGNSSSPDSSPGMNNRTIVIHRSFRPSLPPSPEQNLPSDPDEPSLPTLDLVSSRSQQNTQQQNTQQQNTQQQNTQQNTQHGQLTQQSPQQSHPQHQRRASTSLIPPPIPPRCLPSKPRAHTLKSSESAPMRPTSITR